MAIEKAKLSREEFMEQARLQTEEDIANWKKLYDEHIDNDMLDEDGYPTDDALILIQNWHWSDDKGWFEFINSIWYLKSWGWHEGECEDYGGEMSYRYHISTGGWSGNEDIIRAMQDTQMLWATTWVQSRRGGHYIFELRNK